MAAGQSKGNSRKRTTPRKIQTAKIYNEITKRQTYPDVIGPGNSNPIKKTRVSVARKYRPARKRVGR